MISSVGNCFPSIVVTIALGIGSGMGATPVAVPMIMGIDIPTVASTPQPNPLKKRLVFMLAPYKGLVIPNVVAPSSSEGIVIASVSTD
jgi:hypothetical protein